MNSEHLKIDVPRKQEFPNSHLKGKPSQGSVSSAPTKSNSPGDQADDAELWDRFPGQNRLISHEWGPIYLSCPQLF